MTGGARGVGGPVKKKEEVTKKDKPMGRWVFLFSWSRGDGHCPPPSDAGPAFSALGSPAFSGLTVPSRVRCQGFGLLQSLGEIEEPQGMTFCDSLELLYTLEIKFFLFCFVFNGICIAYPR